MTKPPNKLDDLIPLIADKVKKKLVERGLASEKVEGPCSGGSTASAPSRSQSRTGLIRSDELIGRVLAPQDLARYIDHTLLKPDASKEELRKLCAESRQYHFYSVCVNSSNITFCTQELLGSDTIVIAVVGFPLGATTSAAKAFETTQAVRDGAQEIDMVINIGALKAKDYKLVLEDIEAVVHASGEKPVKVILETGLLSQEEKIIACSLSKIAGAAFVKTSTGFSTGGATVADIKLMRSIVGPEMGVKASGGVRTFQNGLDMIQAGATRLGASASVDIVTGKQGAKKGY